MPRSRFQLGFPRQVVSCYLLFSVIAVTWLSIGVVFTVHAILATRTESECLSQLGRAAAAVEIEHLRHGDEALGRLLDRIRGDGRFSCCAVIDSSGKFIAHTDRRQMGKKAVANSGPQKRWGNVEATEYEDPNGQKLVEFRVPLIVGEESIGQLWVVLPSPDFWTTAKAAAETAPIAILTPLLLIGAGALSLRRLTLPIASVHDQLSKIGRAAASAPIETRKLASRSDIHTGWNRIVDQIARAKQEGGQQDISQRVAKAIRRHQHDTSKQVLESLADGLAVTDAEGKITFANRAITALLGEFQEEGPLNGCSLSEYLSNRIDNPDALDVFMEGGTEKPTSTEINRTSGERMRSLRIARRPLGKGNAGHVWSLRDVTQQKLAETTRNQFIDAATHELRTPLANIKAYAETLAIMDDVDVEQQKEFCNTINQEATRLARFVDDLLSVSSMEIGSLAIHRQSVDLQRFFGEVVEKVQPLLRKKSQKFDVHLSEKLGKAYLDKDKFSAMLVNLLGNASKYTPEKGTVKLQAKLTAGVLSAVVEDTGVGISEEELPKVFEKFFRSSDPRVQAEPGTGLGLALAREIVRLHGGELSLTSQLDEGTQFTVTLPLQQEARL